MNKIKLILLLLFFSSCSVTINQATYDMEHQFTGVITASSISAEINSSINFTIHNLQYTGKKIGQFGTITNYGWDINCDGTVEKNTSVPVLCYV